MDHRCKRTSPSLRNSSSTAHLPRPPPPAFRTLLKRRNETIAASQLYEQHPHPHPTRNSSHSQLAVEIDPVPAPAPAPAITPTPAVAIKEYVKAMGVRPQQRQRQPVAVDRKDTVRVKQDREAPRSARSNRSAYSCRGLKKDCTEGRSGEGRTLEEVQKRVETLISETFTQFKRDHSNSNLTVSQLSRADNQNLRQKQIQELLLWVRQQIQREQPLGERLQDLNRKILLTQKLLAQGSIEGEMMQQVYFNWKSQRGNTTSFSKSTILKESSKYKTHTRLQGQGQGEGQGQVKGRQVVGRYDSTSKAAFQRPSKEFYLSGKDKRSSYSANRQPLPRSSYAAQYLNYGHLVPYAHKPSCVRFDPEVSLAVTASTYQQEYKQKLAMASSVTFKDLDCYRDKFARTDMSFMNSSKKQQNSGGDYKKMAKVAGTKENLNASSIKRSQESLLGCMNMSCGSMFRSESQKQYYWHNTIHTEESDGGLRAEIKDRRMDKLKESFRALAKRR